MKTRYLIFLIFFISACKADTPINNDTIFVTFWNVENLYDVTDDPNKEDEEFLPTGAKEWTQERLDKKMFNLARVFRSMNDGNAPDIIGVAECENQAVLENFIKKYFKDKNYKVAYAESPDNRGVDCGLIFNADKFTLVRQSGYEITSLKDSPTRLILHAILQLKNKEEVSLFINHWPSRRLGASESEYKRIEAAKVLRREVNKLFEQNGKAKIIVMGDFNDDPVDESILRTLGAQPFKCDDTDKKNESIPEKELYNVSYNLFESGIGTITYRDAWNLFDQIIISSSLAMNIGLSYLCDSYSIYNNDLTATRTGKYKGTPFPTYAGNRYLGGYSDHFPVTAKFIIR